MRTSGKQLWVKFPVIFQKTEFDTAEKLKNARNNNYIEMKKDNGIWYNLNSVAPQFLKAIPVTN